MENFSFVGRKEHILYCISMYSGYFKKINLAIQYKKDENWEMTEAKLASRHF